MKARKGGFRSTSAHAPKSTTNLLLTEAMRGGSSQKQMLQKIAGLQINICPCTQSTSLLLTEAKRASTSKKQSEAREAMRENGKSMKKKELKMRRFLRLHYNFMSIYTRSSVLLMYTHKHITGHIPFPGS
jgi:hypothetical protein